MVFPYTNQTPNGVGFLQDMEQNPRDSPFYILHVYVGYSITTGGKIRALNGNNSYGTYGVVTTAMIPNENTVNGNVDGEMIQYADDGVHTVRFANGETITGNVTNATATIVYGVPSKLRYIIKNIQVRSKQRNYNRWN